MISDELDTRQRLECSLPTLYYERWQKNWQGDSGFQFSESGSWDKTSSCTHARCERPIGNNLSKVSSNCWLKFYRQPENRPLKSTQEPSPSLLCLLFTRPDGWVIWLTWHWPWFIDWLLVQKFVLLNVCVLNWRNRNFEMYYFFGWKTDAKRVVKMT